MKSTVSDRMMLFFFSLAKQNNTLESFIDIIASIKLIILQRYGDDHQSNQPSFETSLDQLIANKYSKCSPYRFVLTPPMDDSVSLCQGQPVAGNADGFVEATINEIENLYSQPRS